MPQCGYLAKGAKRPSHTTNAIKFDRIPFDPCNSIKKVRPLSFQGRDISSPAIWATKISAHFGDNNVAQMSRQICSHTPSALNAGAKRRARVNGNGSKEMGRLGLLCHGSNLHRFGIGSNRLGSTLKNAKFKGDNILISTQVHSTQFDLSQFDLSYSTKKVDLILFDLFHSTQFMQSDVPYGHASKLLLGEGSEAIEPYNKYANLFIIYLIKWIKSELQFLRFFYMSI